MFIGVTTNSPYMDGEMHGPRISLLLLWLYGIRYKKGFHWKWSFDHLGSNNQWKEEWELQMWNYSSSRQVMFKRYSPGGEFVNRDCWVGYFLIKTSNSCHYLPWWRQRSSENPRSTTASAEEPSLLELYIAATGTGVVSVYFQSLKAHRWIQYFPYFSKL